MSNVLQQYKHWTKEIDDSEVVRMLRNVFVESNSFILLDGLALSREHVRTASIICEEKGWVDFHFVEENEQSAYYRGELTEKGRKVISD